MSGGAFATLCGRLGIAASYRDTDGVERRPPAATLRTLAAALGHPVADDAGADDALERMADAEWRRGAPPVLVATAAGATLRVTRPAAVAAAPLRWRIETEQGASDSGAVRPEPELRGERRRVDGVDWVAARCDLPVTAAPGYHRLFLESDAGPTATRWRTEVSLVVAPERCYRPPALAGDGRVFGLAAQLYAVRSARNWGIGDFTDLLRLVETAADAGAGMVGVSPLHAPFPDDPEHASPYSPSSRRFLNPLFIDLETVPEYSGCDAARGLVASDAFQARLRALRARVEVDYDGVAAAKSAVLDHLWRHFRDRHLGSGDHRDLAFRDFQESEGTALRRHALFEALQVHLRSRAPAARGWPAWPEAYRRADGEAVAAFARTHANAVGAREYGQWLAREQLDRVGRRAGELGLGLGLYRDLAVGADPGGAETWSAPDAFAAGVSVGAPPDDFNREGQDWGLPPWRPDRLRDAAYRPFVEILRANMGGGGALRIDHVLGLARQFWIPVGAAATDGTYVGYPLDDLLAVVALESHRNRCAVVGEDLGNVPDEIREGLRSFDVLSYRLLYFGRDDNGAFLPPAAYPARALVCAGTHDLPTLAGWWSGTDLEVRRDLGLFAGPEDYESSVAGRAEDRARLLLALSRERLLARGREVAPGEFPELTPELSAAIHRFLARSPARLFEIRLEDLLGQREQVNLPGTTDAYPNWRRRLTLDLEAWPEEPRIAAILDAAREERPRAAEPVRPAGGAAPPPVPVVPRATYRLQLDAGTDFDFAAQVVPYLASLGVSHAYCSPYLQARAGSSHGYDICDHGAIAAELGGADGLERFAVALARHGMSQVMDVVPNHMGVMGSDNAWWLDVLENGPASAYAAWFDIDWSPLKDELRGKVLVPVLEDHYGNALDAGLLRLAHDPRAGTLSIHYHHHRFPLDPRTYPALLGRGVERLAARLGTGHPALTELESLLTAFANLPPRSDTDPASVVTRGRDGAVHRERLAALGARDADIRAWIETCLGEVNGTEDYPADRDRLHELLEAQAYRLAYWRAAAGDINYRRFFDINDLAALRMQREDVFDATHGLILDLVGRGRVTGLRIDHPDGLHDPAAYFRRLHERGSARAGSERAPPGRPSIYLVAEKILAAGEALPDDWPVHGTTGYEFAALAGGVFVDPEGVARLGAVHAALAGSEPDLEDVEYHARRQVAEESLAAELNVLSRELSRIAESDPRTRDFTETTLRRTLAEVAACFPVYRTYVSEAGASDADVAHVERAVGAARRRARAIEPSVFDFVAGALLGRAAAGKGEGMRARVLRFAMGFQQFTAPVAAKGMEDTAFYRYHRLASLNEVGDDPGRPGTPVPALHRALAERARRRPNAMLLTSTHDSKRSEDVRMRLHVLSEVPGEWSRRVTGWSALNRAHRTVVDGAVAPEPSTEYALYQDLIGVWPLSGAAEAVAPRLRSRMTGHAVKTAREAKRRTGWARPDAAYETALTGFVEAILDPAVSGRFLRDVGSFARRIAPSGLWNGLGLVLLKLTAPGVPDVYQGNEVWRFDLVDPDNRRPVDFERRRSLLDRLRSEREREGPSALAARLVAAPEDGAAKLYVVWRALALRRALPALFEDAAYLPLEARGTHSAHVVAFARRAAGRLAVTVVPRLTASLPGWPEQPPLGLEAWGDTAVRLPRPPPALADCFTGVVHREAAELPVADILGRYPVALLVSGPEPPP